MGRRLLLPPSLQPRAGASSSVPLASRGGLLSRVARLLQTPVQRVRETRSRDRAGGSPAKISSQGDTAAIKFTARTTAPSAMASRGISRFPHEKLAYVLGVSDHAGSPASLALSRRGVLPSAQPDGVGTLDYLPFAAQYPARMPPVNASPRHLRATTHDSGPMWFATPSSCETFTHYFLVGFHRRTRLPRLQVSSRTKTKNHPPNSLRPSGSYSRSLTRPLSPPSISFSRLAKDLP